MILLADSDEEAHRRQMVLQEDLQFAYYVHGFRSADFTEGLLLLGWDEVSG